MALRNVRFVITGARKAINKLATLSANLYTFSDNLSNVWRIFGHKKGQPPDEDCPKIVI